MMMTIIIMKFMTTIIKTPTICLLNIGEEAKEQGSNWADEATNHEHWQQS